MEWCRVVVGARDRADADGRTRHAVLGHAGPRPERTRATTNERHDPTLWRRGGTSQRAGRQRGVTYTCSSPSCTAFIPIRVRVHVRVRVRVGLASEPAVASRVPHTARAPSPETMFSALSTYGLSRGPNTILTTFSKLTPSRRTAMI